MANSPLVQGLTALLTDLAMKVLRLMYSNVLPELKPRLRFLNAASAAKRRWAKSLIPLSTVLQSGLHIKPQVAQQDVAEFQGAQCRVCDLAYPQSLLATMS